MNLITTRDEKQWVSEINEILQKEISRTGARRIFLPAGNTPIALYRDWEQRRPAFLEKLTFVQLDEIVNGSGRQRFKKFFEERLPSYIGQFEWVDQGEGRGAQLALLGLGMNGHVAFHEPGLPVGFAWGCVQLSAEACHQLGLTGDENWGITYGLGAILKAPAVVLIIRGENKSEIFERVLRHESGVPASHLMSHPACTAVTLDLKIKRR